MDNGLIFPCPRERVRGEAGETNHLGARRRFRVVSGVGLGPDPVVAKRWGDAGG
jgi:hypothetical protein